MPPVGLVGGEAVVVVTKDEEEGVVVGVIAGGVETCTGELVVVEAGGVLAG